MCIMTDRLDSERLRGFDFRRTDRQTGRQTDRWTDICDCRVAFATENTNANISFVSHA